MAGYNGYTSWNAWNVSLWINNDEETYKKLRLHVAGLGKKRTVEIFTELWKGQTTPDGAVYNKSGIEQALRGILS